MIQRIQTIYLLLAAIISSGLIFIFNLWIKVDGTVFFAKDAFSTDSLLLKLIPILFIGSAILSLVAIFLFKNRQLQFVLGRLNILTNLILLGLLIYQSLNLSGETLVSKKGIGLILPIIAIILLVMANKAIKKDEDLVKSVDRLR
ncbi:DUF4293 family protein [Urechidicola croceus]|uniref:Transcription termination factor Rho n=1 Tax=Urechidicola croceus TaxID=1850246 RepID=A0A1D8P753_9FLAO|nr:DUF4293 family protein [Urechidicola croceus]AOW20410.1 hypothetical protein LPB138_06860 [Urechidicola croceus]